MPDGRDREADLLFEIPYRFGDDERLARVCVLIEHQTGADPRMALRTLLYIVLYWERQWSEWEKLPAPKPEFSLSPVLPIVFHTGSEPWGSARTIKDLLGEPAAFHRFAPDWSPLFWELPKHSVDELLSSGDAFIRLLAIVRVEDAERAEFQRVFEETWKSLVPLSETNRVRWADLIYFIIGWIVHRRPKQDGPELMKTAADLVEDLNRREEVRNLMQTYADELINTGEKRGEQRGEERGELKGRANEARKMILIFGRQRWGVPNSHNESILNSVSDPDELERIAERINASASWDQLLNAE